MLLFVPSLSSDKNSAIPVLEGEGVFLNSLKNPELGKTYVPAGSTDGQTVFFVAKIISGREASGGTNSPIRLIDYLLQN